MRCRIGPVAESDSMAIKYGLALAVLIMAGMRAASADEFYIVRDSATGHCAVANARPTTTMTTVVGDGRAFDSEAEASDAMKRVMVCGAP
jgi:hypothetical protein